MASRYFTSSALFAIILSLANAQQSNIIPEDLRAGFKSNGKEVQVSYTNEAVNGFRDGTVFEKDAVTSEPTFALGDSSGISPSTLYTIILVDTTCPNARKLHYARANFKNNFDITNIATTSDALLDYKAPGAFGEAGDNRQYSFLMYTNPGRKAIDSLQLPGEGENFDVKKFQTDNGLPDATAGVGMVVKLGGTADCGGDQPNDVPENLPSPRPPQITSGRATSAVAAPTSAPAQQSSAAASSPTGDSNEPETTSAPSSTQNQSEDSNQTATSELSEATSAPEPEAPGPSTITSTVILSSRPAGVGASGSPTSSASLVEQTTNAAPGNQVVGGLAMAPLFAVAGVLFW